MSAVPVGLLDPTSPDAPAAAHFGDPLREQRTLASAVGVVDRSHRGVLAVPGADRLTWLHSLTTQHVSTLAPHQGTELLVLSPHGHIEHHAMVTDDGATTWLDVEPGAAPELLAFLDRMRFMMRVEPADATAGWALLSLAGPAAPEAVAVLGAGTLRDPDVVAPPGPKFAAGSVPVRPTSGYDVSPLPGTGGWARRGTLGVDLLVPRAARDDVLATLAVPRCGVWAYEALRVAARVPRLGFETDHRTLPAEVGWLAAAVHLEKGCYRGQETVARVHHLGRPPRRLVLLHLDGVSTDHPPPRHTPVTTPDGRAVGFVGTALRHFELGMVALALLRRSVPDDAPLRVAGAAAAVDAEL
ncbi:MAG TPA: folate-binding protein [Micromonosporaceae bacterium]|nr:folate-binding protein [Micromonosporaceae bacterium]